MKRPNGRKWTKRLVLAALAALAMAVALVVGVAAAWLALGPEGMAQRIAVILRGRGLPVQSFTIAAIGPRGVRLEDVRLGDDGVSADTVQARFSPLRLLDEGRLDRLEIGGMRVPLRIDDDGTVTVPGLDLSLGEGGGEGGGGLPERLPALPADVVVLDDLVVHADTPVGSVSAGLDARLEALDDAMTVTVAVAGRIEHPDGAVALALDGRVAGDWQFSAGLELDEGRVSHGGLEAFGVEGWLRASGSPAGIDQAGGMLLAARVSWSGGAITDVSVTGRGHAGRGHDGGPRALVMLRAGAGDDTARLAADAVVEGPVLDPLSVRLDASLVATALERLWPLPSPASLPVGRGALDLSVTGPLGPMLAAAAGTAPLRAVTARGHVALRLADVRLPQPVPAEAIQEAAERAHPDAPPGAAAAIAGRFAMAHGVLSLTGDRPWQVSATPAGLGWPVQLTVRQRPGLTGPLTVTMAGGDPTLWLDADVSVATPLTTADGAVRGRVALDAQGRPAFHIGMADLMAAPIRLDGLTVTPERVRLAAAGTADRFTARLAARIAAAGEVSGGIALTDALIEPAGTLTWADGAVAYTPADCLAVSVRGLVVVDSVQFPDGLSLCMAAADGALVEARLAGEAAGRLQAAAVARPFRVRLDAAGEPVELDLPSLTVVVEAAPDPAPAVVIIDLDGAGIRLPRSGLAAEQVAATLTLRPMAEDGPPDEFRIADGLLRLTGTAPLLVPLRTTGEGVIGDDGLSFTLAGVGAAGSLRAAARGDISFVGGGGRVDFDIAPVTFAPGVRSPGDVFPVLQDGPILAATGAVSARGEYGWGARRARGARIRLEDLGVVTDFLEAAGIDGTVALTGFHPVVAPPGQRLDIAVVDLGILLEGGQVVFGLTGDRLAVSALRFDWAGGQVSAEPFTVALGDPDDTVVLTANGIDLAALAGQLPMEDLSVTGRLRGRVPLRLDDDTIHFDDALLEATGPGLIRYGAGAADLPDDGGESVDLLLEALRNFHYDELALTLNGRTGGDMAARLRISGANPDLLGGYPFALNVNVAGALEQMLRRGLETTRYAERFEEYYRDRAADLVTDAFLDEIESLQE